MTKYPEFRGAVFAPEIPDRTDDRESTSSAGELGRVDGAVEDARSALASEQGNVAPGESAGLVRDLGFWSEIDAEADARTPSPAQRAASRRQGRALLRAARVAWPDAAGLAELAASVRASRAREAGRSAATGTAGAGSGGGMSSMTHAADGLGVGSRDDTGGGVARGDTRRRESRGGSHHAVVLGAAAAAAGCTPLEAARIAAYQAVAGPVSAAVRLLALDPMRATGLLAGLAGDIDRIAVQGADYAGGPLGDLPCASALALDLLAETHIRAEVRLFES